MVLTMGSFVLAACFRSGAQDQFYMLKPVKETAGVSSHAEKGPLIGLGPIKVPSYLDRPQIVTATSEQEFQLAENQRWAERLDDNIARVTQENLAALVPTDRIVMHPWSRDVKPDIQATIQIQELHVDADGNARMVAMWSLKPAKGETISRRFACAIAVPPKDFPQIVAAESECLARLNREMVQGIRQQSSLAAP
jgi:uncharacterized protein